MADFRTLLVTTDFSELSAIAAEPARLLAERFGSRIVVVHVVEELLPPLLGEYAALPVEEILTAQVERADEALRRFVHEQFPSLSGCETEVRRGIAHLEILQVATERQADLIVMATHGRGFLSHALFGSTTERVLRRAPCPVMTVRGGARDAI